MLMERLPEGSVVAVDGSALDGRRGALGPAPPGRGPGLRLIGLRLEQPVDVVFSSAVFHWVLDHDALFSSMHGA